MKAVVNCTLVTCAGPNRPRLGAEMREVFAIEDGAMLIDSGIIVDVNYRKELEFPSGIEMIDAGGGSVLPGFVDAHTHPVFGGNRVDEFEKRAGAATYQEIAAAGGGIRSTVCKTRAATQDELLTSAGERLQWMLRCGTTTLEAKSGYGLSLADEIKMLEVLKRLGPQTVVPTFLGAHAVPEGSSLLEYERDISEVMLPAVVESGLAEFADIFCEENYFDIETSRRIMCRAKELGLGMRMHVDQLTNGGGAKLAAELGAKTADHLEQTDEDGILALRKAGVSPVLLPGSVYALGLPKYPNGRKMIDEGLPVVLATDFNPGSSPSPSLPMMMSLACTQMKMLPAEALIACTVNAAHSLNRGARIGSLEPGKKADFCIWESKDYREIAYYFGHQRASAVYVGGELAA